MADTDELTGLVAKLADLRSKEDQASQAKKVITQELEATELRLLELLEQSGLKDFSCGSGKIYLSFRSSVKIPRTPEEIAALAEYLRAQGKYDMVFKPNSASLNSCWKEEFELAKERGELDFNMPGVAGVTLIPTLNFRSPK